MKRQIDPHLENLTDDELLPGIDINAEERSPVRNKQVDPELTLDTGDDILTSNDMPTNIKSPAEVSLSIESVDKTHHHSSSGSSSSSHHHGSSGSSSSSHHHSSSSHSSSKKKKKKSRLSTSSKIAIAVLAVILIIAVVIIGVFLFLQQSGKNDMMNTDAAYEEIIEYKGHTYVYNKDVVAIAFIGVDKRELGLDDGLIGTAGQADADIVLTVDTKTGRAMAIAVPRDTMVDVDLYSTNGIFLRTEKMQLCLSYAYGNGTDTSAENVTTSLSRILYNVPISKYFALDLDGIQPLNDAIGGVTLTSLYDFDDLGIKKGDEITLTGDMTEKYVRTRDTDTVNASLNRTQRQVQYIKAFASQLVPAVVQDFSIVGSLYNTASEYSTTNISLSNTTYLATLLLSKGITEFETVTLEGEMKASENINNSKYVYAEFYPNEDKLMEAVLSAFYTRTD